MKPNFLVKPTLILLALAVSFISCKNNNNVPDNNDNTEQEKPKPTKPPRQTISYKYAKTLEEEFVNTRYKAIKKVLNVDDTREFWFDLEELKKYIAYVEYEADRLGYENLGIRIYNGAYPDDKKFPDPGLSTVFLVPTGDEKPKSKGGILTFSIPLSPESNNITEIQSYNYGQAGRPPKKM
ncbi:hypothetical protein [Hyunsoonleella pacifica]|uniref:Lipoprotein n=1 Tax=Hyunsoonleella pacifica TaxID=1080224 RepID=A0A4Q9FTJ7_9FLAO|nr:hypothetical protein [Hyunsoonleella pacifica]TBN17499.1 hypothetical protein EYD46_04065 [Hyunsoonleella pacifica]GGD11477.1 hypothetical protein GCM10011368_11800 [Hyunsoonleella pacifica]